MLSCWWHERRRRPRTPPSERRSSSVVSKSQQSAWRSTPRRKAHPDTVHLGGAACLGDFPLWRVTDEGIRIYRAGEYALNPPARRLGPAHLHGLVVPAHNVDHPGGGRSAEQGLSGWIPLRIARHPGRAHRARQPILVAGPAGPTDPVPDVREAEHRRRDRPLRRDLAPAGLSGQGTGSQSHRGAGGTSSRSLVSRECRQGPPRTKEPLIKGTAALRRRILSRQARVGVVGQGYVGLSLACAAADAGFPVTGIDTDEQRVADLAEGILSVP